MTDTELLALTALLNAQTVVLYGDNVKRERCGYGPAWTSDCDTSDIEKALEAELRARGVLPGTEKGRSDDQD